MKNKISFIILVVVFFVLSSSNIFAQVLKIDNPELLSKKTITLNTIWEFFPNQFVEPDNSKIVSDYLVSVPLNWSNYNLGGTFDNGEGAGTFRLTIENLKPYTNYAFSLFDITGTASRIFANGKEIAVIGKPSLNLNEMISDQKMGIAVFTSDDNGSAEILIHVSNKFHRSGGIWTSIKIGEESFFRRNYSRQQNITFLFLGALFTVFLYQLLLFFFRKYDMGSLYLAFFTLAIFVRILSTPFSLLKLYIPSFPYSISLRLEYTALFMAPIFFVLYLNELVKNVFSKIMIKIIAITGITIGAIVYLCPIFIGCRLVLVSQIFALLTTIYTVITMVYSYFKTKSPLIRLECWSLFVIFAGVFHDVLDLSHIAIVLPNVSLLPYAFLLFVFFQIAITARLFEQSQNAIDKLSETLVETNKAYYRFVPREFLSLLSKKDITDVHLGEWITRDMTLLCADIRNFTTISESIDGKAVFSLLNRYLMRIAPIIRENNGFIEKYLGDGIIALFSENGEDAFNSAVAIQKEIAELRKELQAENLPRIDIGIGIHYGKIVLGTVGGKDRMNEITLSKAIETVMNIESLTKSYKKPILASRTAVEYWEIQKKFTVTRMNQEYALQHGIKETIFAIDDDILEPLP